MVLVQARDGQQFAFGSQTQTVYGRSLLSLIAIRCHHELNVPYFSIDFYRTLEHQNTGTWGV